jgi:hypothetical protein
VVIKDEGLQGKAFQKYRSWAKTSGGRKFSGKNYKSTTSIDNKINLNKYLPERASPLTFAGGGS